MKTPVLACSFLLACLLVVGIHVRTAEGMVIVPRDVEDEINDIENEAIEEEIFKGNDVEELGSPLFFDEDDLVYDDIDDDIFEEEIKLLLAQEAAEAEKGKDDEVDEEEIKTLIDEDAAAAEVIEDKIDEEGKKTLIEEDAAAEEEVKEDEIDEEEKKTLIAEEVAAAEEIEEDEIDEDEIKTLIAEEAAAGAEETKDDDDVEEDKDEEEHIDLPRTWFEKIKHFFRIRS